MIFCEFCRNMCLGITKIVGGWENGRKRSKQQMAAIFNKFGERDGINWKMKLSSDREENWKQLEQQDEAVYIEQNRIQSVSYKENKMIGHLRITLKTMGVDFSSVLQANLTASKVRKKKKKALNFNAGPSNKLG